MSVQWYLYAIAAGDPGSLPAGIGGQPVYAQLEGSVWLLVSEFDAQPSSDPHQTQQRTHEKVVEAAMQSVTVLPFRFGTVASRQASQAFVDRCKEQIEQGLQRVAGHVEVTIKVLDGECSLESESSAQVEPERSVAGFLFAGALSLLRRQAELFRGESRQKRAMALLSKLECNLGPYTTDRQYRLMPSVHVLATLTHLIPLPAFGPWAEAAARLREQHRSLDFLSSGPGPPYHFSRVTDDGPNKLSPAVTGSPSSLGKCNTGRVPGRDC